MVFCFCGKPAIVRTSWTNRNPGQRFYSCPITGSKCKFIGWYDPEMCQSSVDIIPGLLKSKSILEVKVKASQDEAKRLKKLLIISWIGFVVIVIAIMVMYGLVM